MSGGRRRFLGGVTVLDLTTFLSGPFATQLLADMGADVIKIESRSGDSARGIPPHFIGEDSAYFHAVNRSKRSVQIDLKTEAGREAFLALCAASDVVIENFRPGVMERLGLGTTELRARFPHLITCSISGFGPDSPHRDVPAYDAMIQAWTGGMSLTGHPGAPPARMGIPIGDLAAGMYAALGVAGASARRERTGDGEHVDVAMYDAQIALLGYQAVYYLYSGDVPGPQGSGHVSIPTYRAFRCGDGEYLMVTANTEPMWRGLCEALHVEALVDDPRFATNADRLAHAELLWSQLEPAFEALGSAEAHRRLSEAGVPVAKVNNVAEALKDPHVAVRRMILGLSDEQTGHALEVPGNPVKAKGMRSDRDAGFPPVLGAHTMDVLTNLGGLEPEQVEALRRDGVIGPFA